MNGIGALGFGGCLLVENIAPDWVVGVVDGVGAKVELWSGQALESGSEQTDDWERRLSKGCCGGWAIGMHTIGWHPGTHWAESIGGSPGLSLGWMPLPLVGWKEMP